MTPEETMIEARIQAYRSGKSGPASDLMWRWLQDHGIRRFTAKEIQDATGVNQGTIWQNLQQMMNAGYISRAREAGSGLRAGFIYTYHPEPIDEKDRSKIGRTFKGVKHELLDGPPKQITQIPAKPTTWIEFVDSCFSVQ